MSGLELGQEIWFAKDESSACLYTDKFFEVTCMLQVFTGFDHITLVSSELKTQVFEIIL